MNDEIKSMLQYFGESPTDSSASEAGTKPEDFFALIVAFSSNLQVCWSYSDVDLCFVTHHLLDYRERLPT